MRFLNSPEALDADKEGCHDKREADDDRRNRLGLSTPVRVFFVGWLDRKLQPEKHDRRADSTGEGFNAIGNQSQGVTQISRHTFERCQDQVGADLSQRRRHALVDRLFEWSSAKVFRHGWSPSSAEK